MPLRSCTQYSRHAENLSLNVIQELPEDNDNIDNTPMLRANVDNNADERENIDNFHQ